jgi:lipid II:glycine glycyltransferase (peptidoglycan interpeptide bridge formation enzyme)
MKAVVEQAQLRELDVNGGLLQSGFWAAFRGRLGWRPRAFRCRWEGREFILLVLVRPLPLGFGLAYAPHGPELAEPPADREGFLLDLAGALRPALRGCLFLRFDLPWGTEGLGKLPAALARRRGLYRATMDVQPPSTVVLDLAAAEGELLAAMKSKTRYNIRLAEKKGVEVSLIGASQGGNGGFEKALAEWYRLYQQTARRDRITVHDRGYYRTLFSAACGYGPGAPELYLLSARYRGELLAGIIVALRGDWAWYLYGASSDRRRNLMPAYALQWGAIVLAKHRGCRFYDLFGIPPDSDPGHPMHGLFRFKTGFGGRVINRPGCYDAAFRPLTYRLYREAERLRAAYYRKWRKRTA